MLMMKHGKYYGGQSTEHWERPEAGNQTPGIRPELKGWDSTALCTNVQWLVVGVNWIQMNQTQCRVLIEVILAAVTTKLPDHNGCNRVKVCVCVCVCVWSPACWLPLKLHELIPYNKFLSKCINIYIHHQAVGCFSGEPWLLWIEQMNWLWLVTNHEVTRLYWL